MVRHDTKPQVFSQMLSDSRTRMEMSELNFLDLKNRQTREGAIGYNKMLLMRAANTGRIEATVYDERYDMSIASPSFMKLLALPLLAFAASGAFAFSLSDLSNADASSGLKAALEKGSSAAVAKLGVENGFLHNEKVRIPLPKAVEQIRPVMQLSGRGHKLDELELAMNRAAESAVQLAKPLLLNAVRSMTVADAKRILTGGNTSVTNFFHEKTASPLAQQFLPIVKSVTDRSGLAARYNATLGQAAAFNLIRGQPTVEEYVTQRTLDGLFHMIAEEEKAIRENPAAAGSAIISKVFGSMR